MRVLQLEFSGRLGNQMFQYAAARHIAERDGWKLQTRPWVGQSIFNDVPSNPLSGKPDRTVHNDIPTGNGIVKLTGYFQSRRFIPPRDASRRWFSFRSGITARVPSRKYMVCALRRGDICDMGDPWPVVSWRSYVRCMMDNCLFMDCLVSSDDWVRGIGRSELTEDFIIMMHADVLLRANSSYSWWAGELGNAKVFSPQLPNKAGFVDCKFVPGNSEPITVGGERL